MPGMNTPWTREVPSLTQQLGNVAFSEGGFSILLPSKNRNYKPNIFGGFAHPSNTAFKVY